MAAVGRRSFHVLLSVAVVLLAAGYFVVSEPCSERVTVHVPAELSDSPLELNNARLKKDLEKFRDLKEEMALELEQFRDQNLSLKVEIAELKLACRNQEKESRAALLKKRRAEDLLCERTQRFVASRSKMAKQCGNVKKREQELKSSLAVAEAEAKQNWKKAANANREHLESEVKESCDSLAVTLDAQCKEKLKEHADMILRNSRRERQ